MSLENDHKRSWALFLTDYCQDDPKWFIEFSNDLANENGIDSDTVTVALETIARFPVMGSDEACQAVINSRAAEERLMENKVLINWLYADRNRMDYLADVFAYKPADYPQSLLEALRCAWEENFRAAIAFIGKRLSEEVGQPPYADPKDCEE